MKIFILILLLVILNLQTQILFADDFSFEKKKIRNGNDFSYFVRGVKWKFKEGEDKVIFVCWENPQKVFESKMKLVQQSIQDTWQKKSLLVFKGWQKCENINSGIRIFIDDSGPQVNAFGRNIDRMHKGMILNFTFNNWKPSFDVKSNIDKYIYAIAVHEFGHALGFAHEQNRPGTPDKCAKEYGQNQPNEITLTEYDFESVMNYCNKKYANWGVLSKFDISGLQEKYGKGN